MFAAGRAHLEASAERWSRLLGLLEELWRWICMKDEELAKQMPVGGDVPTLLQQQNHCMVGGAASGFTLSSLQNLTTCTSNVFQINTPDLIKSILNRY